MPWVGVKPVEFSKNIKAFQKKRLNKVADILIGNLVKGSPADTGRFMDKWKSSGEFPFISITNNAHSDGGFPYPIFLEEGGSPQAPHGVLRVNVSSVKTLMDAGVL